MEKFINTLSNQGMWGAIIACIGIIAIGFFLTKMKILNSSSKGVLNSIVLKVALPALAFTGFMKSITKQELIEQSIILGLSFAFYILLNVVAILSIKYGKFLSPIIEKLSFKKNKVTKTLIGEETSESKVLVTWMMLIFGSVTFFGLPIIKAVYPGGVLAANIWTIPYRIFLYSLAFMMMSKIKFTKETFGKSIKTALLNPIVIATFIGLVLWLTQLIPGTQVGKEGWFNLSKTAPYIHKIFDTLGKLSSPLIWITIGMTLAATPIMNGIKNWKVWLFVFLKLIIIPLIVLLIMLPFALNSYISKEVASSMVIFAAVPPATVVIAYAMEYKNNQEYAAQCSAISTLVAIFTMPIWIIILGVIF